MTEDILLARRNVREMREHGELSPELEGLVSARGLELVESVRTPRNARKDSRRTNVTDD
jgi:hypothetical protein